MLGLQRDGRCFMWTWDGYFGDFLGLALKIQCKYLGQKSIRHNSYFLSKKSRRSDPT